MELELEPREVEFRERLEEWLAAVTRPDGLRDFGATPTLEDVPPGRQWQALLLQAGFAGLSWPAPYGPGATMAELAIFAEMMAGAELPRQLSFVSMELAGPILIAFGTPAQQDRFLPRLLSGDDIWCQLFSEPGAGSDLAAVATRASKVGDHWEASGQKIWTSGAHYSQYGLLLARTGPKVPPHAGITCFAVRMDAPGIEVRPIRQMDGESKFNEVFLDSVRLSADDVIGAVERRLEGRAVGAGQGTPDARLDRHRAQHLALGNSSPRRAVRRRRRGVPGAVGPALVPGTAPALDVAALHLRG